MHKQVSCFEVIISDTKLTGVEIFSCCRCRATK